MPQLHLDLPSSTYRVFKHSSSCMNLKLLFETGVSASGFVNPLKKDNQEAAAPGSHCAGVGSETEQCQREQE